MASVRRGAIDLGPEENRPDTDEVGFANRSREEVTRIINGELAYKDPVELKPSFRVNNASAEARLVDHYPMGILNLRVRLQNEGISIVELVRGEYMKWAIVVSLAECLSWFVRGTVKSSDVLFCMEEVEILEVDMPSLGIDVWQFCDFRFDYRVRMSALAALKGVERVFSTMKGFEKWFCRLLEEKLAQYYNLTVVGLQNKQNILMDGTRLSGELHLFQAAQAGDVKRILELLNQGIHVDACQKASAFPMGLLDEELHWQYVVLGRTPLLGAAEEGSWEAMRVLLDWKADVNRQDNAGFHALYLAAGQEVHVDEALNLLLERNASLDLRNKTGYSPLHNACGSGNARAIRLLVDARADVNIKSESGAGVTHVAVLNKQPEALQVLKDLNVNIDAPAFGGNTAVHEAVMLNSPELIDTLFSLKADINIESGPEHEYATPLRMAVDRKRKKAAKALHSLGALESLLHDLDNGENGIWHPGQEGPRVEGRAVYQGEAQARLPLTRVML